MENSVIIEKKEGIATIFLNEPYNLNAISPSIQVGLDHAIDVLEKDDDIKVVILAGKGRAFCVGGDIKHMSIPMSVIEGRMYVRSIGRIVQKIRNLNKPIIASVHGYAAGAGFSLALASDLIVAEKTTQFILAFKNVGLIPDSGGLYFLPRIFGSWKAKELIWNGDAITAEEGEKYGFVNYLVPVGQAFDKAYQVATNLVKGPMQAYVHTKSIINQSATYNLNDLLEMESYAQSILMATEDHREGITAFHEKRSPKFLGK